MPEELDVNAVSSPAPVVTTSPVEPETPIQPVVAAPVEEAKIPLSRLNEVLEQKKAAEAREARLVEALQQVRQPAPTSTKPDFWEGRINHADPATAQYWQGQREMFELAVEQGKQRAIAEMQPVIQAGMRAVAQITTRDFRRENPDVSAGSVEEQQIMGYMNGDADGMRHSLESARNNVVIKRLEAENRALKGKHSAIPQKVAANVEQSAGIPASAGLPEKAGGWRQDVADAYDASGGDLLTVANVLTGKKR